MNNYNLPVLGAGVGLRHEHLEQIIADKPEIAWFEIIVENFLGIGGWSADALKEIVKDYPVLPHGVCLSLGSTDPINFEFLKTLKCFLDQIDAKWMSDHLCFTMIDHVNLSELIPLPFTDEAVNNTVSRIKIIQEYLERPFLIENVTRYITVSDREMNEAEFITRILNEADCGLLLDITNVHLNSLYHGYNACEFITSLPLERVGQMHLAGYQPDGDVILDTHDAPVPKEVWELFSYTIGLTGESNPLIEWDADLPSLERLLREASIAENYMQELCRAREIANE